MGKITVDGYYDLNKEQHKREFGCFKQKHGDVCPYCGGKLIYHKPKENGPKYVIFFRCDKCQWAQNYFYYPEVKRPYDGSEDMVFIWRSDLGMPLDGFMQDVVYRR